MSFLYTSINQTDNIADKDMENIGNYVTIIYTSGAQMEYSK